MFQANYKMLLNYNFKMVFLSGKWLVHEDELSRLTPKPCEPFEETVVATLRLEIEIKSMLYNTIRELPVTMMEIRNEAKTDKYIIEKKKQTIDQQYKRIDGEKIFPSVMELLMYGEWVIVEKKYKKTSILVILVYGEWKLLFEFMFSAECR